MHGFFSRMVLGGLFVVVAVLSVVACTPAKAMMGFKNEVVRYRVTVEIETPEGIKTGSAVREAGAYTEPSILPDQGGTSYNITKGEAVVIDLGQRGVVFALMGGGQEARLVSRAFRLEGKMLLQLKPSEYPNFMMFRDVSDPSSAQRLLQFDMCPNERGVYRSIRCIKRDFFSEALGDGVFLKSVKIESVLDAVSFGNVEKYMPKADGKPHIFSRNDFIVGDR